MTSGGGISTEETVTLLTLRRTDYACLLVLFATLFLAVADNQVISPLLPLLSVKLGVAIPWLGQLVTGYALAAGLVAFGLSPWSDRLGRPALIRWGLLLFSLASVISSLAGQFSTLLVGRLATGIAAGILSFNVLAYVGDRFAYAQRGRAMGMVYSAYFAALMAGVPLGSWIAERWGWQAVFLAGAVCALAVFSGAQFFLRDVPSHVPPEGAAFSHLRSFSASRDFLRGDLTRRGLQASFLVSGGIVCFLTYLGAWLHAEHQMGTRQIGNLFLVAGLAALVASPMCGYLSDRVGKVRVFLVGNVAAGAVMLALPWLTAGPYLWVGFFALSLAAALRQSPLEAIITEVVGGNVRGRYIAFRNLFSQLGIAVSVFAGGLLFQNLGYKAVAVWAAALTVAASFFIPRVAE